MAPASIKLLQLPTEILMAIPTYLPNRDIKSLRLACKTLCATSQLRWDRVFLSANLRNIEVFCAIADHEVIRKQIFEIIWDDARLKDELGPRNPGDHESPDSDCDFDPDFDDQFDVVEENEDDYDDDEDDDNSDDEELPPWFAKACQKNLGYIKRHKDHRVTRADNVTLAKLMAPIALQRSWEYYQKLIQQQRQVLATKSDDKAFKYGLRRFPALRRVTVTPSAHGWLLRPLYETPMIGAFPPGFNYPIPRGWPVWRQDQRLWEDSSESQKNRWRGFRLTMQALAAAGAASQRKGQGHGVTEIVVDVNQFLTGLNAHIFDEDCAEQQDLAAILRHPHFRRLDLALGIGGLQHYGWRAFRSGCLRRTLAAAPALEHASLTTDLGEAPYHVSSSRPPSDQYFIPLRDIFPISIWTQLRHFRLSRFAVRQGDLFSFLEALPATLRSLELSFLFFLEGNHRDLVADMRDRLGWRDRPVEQRPRVAIGISLVNSPFFPRRGIWADRPVEQFIYHDGPNPFGSSGGSGNQIPYGIGGVVKDTIDPAFERPWVYVES